MATFQFQQSKSFSDGTTITPVLAVPAQTTDLQVTATAGPMSNAATLISFDPQLSADGGQTWQSQGAMTGQGGMIQSVKGGPADTPNTITGTWDLTQAAGQKARVVIGVTNGPVTIAVSGTLT